MSNVTLKNYHIICLEYRQEREDEDYGSCLWARFYFKCDSLDCENCDFLNEYIKEMRDYYKGAKA